MAISSILLATRTQLWRRWPPLRMGLDGRGQNEHIQMDWRDTRLCWSRHSWLNSSSCMNDFYFYKEVLSHFFGNQWLSWSFVFPLVIEAWTQNRFFSKHNHHCVKQQMVMAPFPTERWDHSLKVSTSPFRVAPSWGCQAQTEASVAWYTDFSREVVNFSFYVKSPNFCSSIKFCQNTLWGKPYTLATP